VVATLVRRLVDFQPVAAGGVGDELPDADRFVARMRFRVEAGLRHREIDEPGRQSAAAQFLRDHRLDFFLARERFFDLGALVAGGEALDERVDALMRDIGKNAAVGNDRGEEHEEDHRALTRASYRPAATILSINFVSSGSRPECGNRVVSSRQDGSSLNAFAKIGSASSTRCMFTSATACQYSISA